MLKNDTVRNELFMQAANDMAGMLDMKATNQGQLRGHVGVEGKAGLEILGTGGGVTAGGEGSASLTRNLTKNMAFTELSNTYDKYKGKGNDEVNKQLSGFVGRVESKAQDHDFVTKTAKAMEEAEGKLKSLFNEQAK